jgi:hypothetical protein
MATLRVKEAFSCDIKGVPYTFPAGALIDSNHPAIEGRKHLFETVQSYMEGEAKRLRGKDVEEATAAPGEKRNLTTDKDS